MNIASFSVEFKLNIVEIRKLNKMYLKSLFQERVRFSFTVLFIFFIFLNLFYLDNNTDLIILITRNLILIILFLVFQYSFVDTIGKVFFDLTKRLLKFDNFISKYKFNFTNSLIYVYSPLGEFTHKWSHIDKAILTKDFFFLYVKEKNNYIISISNKYNQNRDMRELIAFVESNVTKVIKV
ncbi:YcxB-like protein [Flavobacterium resistens]|uniref:YcxB-like protein n=1 Tax=Flavobacterium resistens TaxID=443612 RepID=A0A521D8V1_9FLAO|nr:hypothetical protein [Flavobacterium resistens]SMO68032.1 YcxB-like protein [Flavobacterium resistens]